MAPEDQVLPLPEPAQEPAALEELPVLAVRDTVIFPGALLPLTVGRPASLALVQSLGENRLLAVVSQLHPTE
jgi:ATP-dependent Lon protease